MKYSAKITNDNGETIAKIAALSFESLEEQLHKLKAFDVADGSDVLYEQQRDDKATETDHYEETIATIEANNQSLIS